MMKKQKIVGIVCEYNPFHNGHIYHIQQVKKLLNPDVLVCVMSGNFVQRGEAAICDKWLRAETAVLHGVDLVVELPFLYATQSANYFAKAAMEILQLAQVSDFVFGSETDNMETLEQYAFITNNFKKVQVDGISPSKAYEHIYGDLHPNDILGINYLKYKGNMKGHTIKRTNAYHDHHLIGEISSATSIRKAISDNQDIQYTTPMRNLNTNHEMNHYFKYLKSYLQLTPNTSLTSMFMVDEGIEHLIKKQVDKAHTYNELVQLCTSKRYTSSKIKRTLLHIMMQTSKEEINHLPKPSYLRILAFNEKGKQHLANIKDDVLIASKYTQIPTPFKEKELQAAKLYASVLSLNNQDELIQKEFRAPIYIKKSCNS